MAARYEALLKLASGGMATVWIGTARGALGFRQLVAIKKPHPHLLESPGFKDELIAEARLASMIRHANVVDVRDVEVEGSSLSLVMDFIEGASLGELLVAASKKQDDAPRIPARVAVRILRDACAGLHAAHELVDERSRHVGLVHRDISPQNILVGEDGIARVTDFGVAKFAKKNMQSTSDGSLKGKVAYMAPEYLRGEPIDRRFDIFAVGVVLWEALTGKRCFRAESEAETMRRILDLPTPRLSTIDPKLAPLDDVVACALEKSAAARFQNAAAMGAALETAANEAGLMGSYTEVAAAVKELVGPKIEERKSLIRSKLAHEPSLASIGGELMSPLASAQPASPAPDTERQESREHPTSETVTTGKRLSTVPTATPLTVPDPLPATAQAGHAPNAPHPFAATLQAGADPPPPPVPAPPVPTPTPTPNPRDQFGPTLRAGTAEPVPPTTLQRLTMPLEGTPRRSALPDGMTTEATRPEGETTRDAVALAHDLDEVPAPPQRSIVPLLVSGVVLLAVAIGGGALAMKGHANPTPTPASAEPVVSAPVSAAAATPSVTARAAVAASVSSTPPIVTATGAAKPRPAPLAVPAPKRPPANPYE